MSKQFEVEKAIKTCIAIEQSCGAFDGSRLTNQILRCLKELQVVIKVDRELPEIPTNAFEDYKKYEVENKCKLTQRDMLGAGYVAVESLVKE